MTENEEIRATQVELLRREYIKALEFFLIQRGWEVTCDGFDTWSKGAKCLLTNEEAFWFECKENPYQ